MKNNEKFEDIVKDYLKSVYNFVFRLIGDKSEAEDITQETFVKIWKNLEKFDEMHNLKTWIFTIARNTAIDWLRKKRSILFSDLDKEEETFENTLAAPEILPDEIFSRNELKKDLEKALDKINPEYKSVVILHLTENLTFEEISKITGEPMNTVKSRYRRALHQIRSLLRI